MTYGEALDLLTDGNRLNVVHQGQRAQVWLEKDTLMVASRNVTAGRNLSHLLTMEDISLLPEPDTAEKFVRDSIPLLQQMGELKSLESAALVLGIVVRGKALIQQMDGEK